jgi:hypothetical protein
MSANDRQPGGNHYSTGKMSQHWDFMAKYNVGYLEGNASKYAYRFPIKAGDLDLQKADHYVEKIIDMATNEGYVCRGFVPHGILQNFCYENEMNGNQTELMFLLLSEWSVESMKAARNVIADLRNELYPQP